MIEHRFTSLMATNSDSGPKSGTKLVDNDLRVAVVRVGW